MDVLAQAGPVESNPFIILTFIVAPAILTNASALSVLSTSNRFARAIDRARDLSRQIEEARRREDHELLDRLDSELLITEKRAIYLVQAVRAFYTSLGGFAFGAFVSLLGAALESVAIHGANRFLAPTAILAVFIAVGGLMTGSVLLFNETRMTVGIIQDRIHRLNASRRQ